MGIISKLLRRRTPEQVAEELAAANLEKRTAKQVKVITYAPGDGIKSAVVRNPNFTLFTNDAADCNVLYAGNRQSFGIAHISSHVLEGKEMLVELKDKRIGLHLTTLLRRLITSGPEYESCSLTTVSEPLTEEERTKIKEQRTKIKVFAGDTGLALQLADRFRNPVVDCEQNKDYRYPKLPVEIYLFGDRGKKDIFANIDDFFIKGDKVVQGSLNAQKYLWKTYD